jgi:hypothetical protein
LSVALPPVVVRFVCQPTLSGLLFKFAEISPGFIVVEPGMHQTLRHGETFATFHLQQISDDVDGFAGDLFPRLGRVHEAGVLDLLVDVFVLVERERAGQAHVDDHARRPHVQAAVVALVPGI